MEDLISVIVPVYKVEKFLRKCIESIVNQTYKNLEIILVDDGSPDGCPEICDEYARRDPRIKVVHKTNGGLSDARNAGLAEAEGEFIGFVDSDDFIEAEMYRKLLCALKENDADMAVCNEICVDENSARMELVLYSRPYGILSKEDALKEVAQGIFPSVAWNKLYRRKIFGNVKFIRGKCHEDEFFLHEIVFQCEKIVTISDRLYFYTIGRKGSITAEFSINRFDGVEAMCCRYKFFEEKGLDDLLPSAKNLVIAVWADRRGKFFPRTKSRRLRVREIDRMVKEICIPAAKSGGKSVSVKTKIKFAFPFFYSLWVRFRIFPRARKIAALLKYVLRFRCRYVLLQTPLHGNLGDQAIVLAEKEFLKRLPRGTFAELPSELTLFHEKLFARFTPKNRIVLITGGGFLGCLWPDEEFAFRRNLQAFSKNKIIVFPQTVTFDTKTSGGKEFFEESRRIYEGHGNLTIFVREKESLSFMQENMNVKTFLLPDVVLLLDAEKSAEKTRTGAALCMRSDREKIILQGEYEKIVSVLEKTFGSEIFLCDNVLNRRILPRQRKKCVFNRLKEFSGRKIVVTDRLHAMIFCAVTNTPCIALANSSGKVKSLYETWLKNCEFIKFARNAAEFENILRGMNLEKEYKFDRKSVEESFDGARKFF